MDMNLPRNKDFTFDNGDVRIFISGLDGETQFGMVCSQAMCLASPVWKKFIYPSFRQLPHDEAGEEKSVGEPIGSGVGTNLKGTDNSGEGEHLKPVEELDFTEDDPAALYILLRIAHLDFSSVSKKLKAKELWEVAVLCDQYDCVHLVSMFLPRWLSDAETKSKQSDCERWLFIAWAFGRTEIFQALAQKMLTSVSLSMEGDIVGFGGKAIDFPMPLGITESILEIRNKTIQSILDTFYPHVDRFQNYQSPRCKEGKKECDASIYGSKLDSGLEKKSARFVCALEI